MTINRTIFGFQAVCAFILFLITAQPVCGMKYQTFTLHKLVETAEIVVDCTVIQTEPRIRVSVISALKGNVPEEIEVTDQNIWLHDRPALAPKQRAILFLKRKGEGFQYAALGTQVLWPKQVAQWPFSDSAIATHEATLAVIKTVAKFLGATSEKDKLEQVDTLLKSVESLAQLQGVDAWRDLNIEGKASLIGAVQNLNQPGKHKDVQKLAASILMSFSTEKWIAPADGLKRLCPASRVAHGKLVLKTLEKGGRLLYSINDGEKKLAALGEEITLEKGQKLAIIERHTQIEIVPLVAEGKTRFGVIVREDYRSFGKELTVSTSAFDLGSDDIVAVPEVEGRAALAAAKTKSTNK